MSGTMRGFTEFTPDKAGREAAENYHAKLIAEGMRAKLGQYPIPNDKYIVKWYNPKYFRSFDVPRKPKNRPRI